MQEKSHFGAIFCLEDARVASYRLRAPDNATSVIGDPAEVRGRVYPNNIRQAPQNAASVFRDPAG